MKYLKILQPSLDTGVTVTSTSWEVNTKKDFTGTSIMSVSNDTVNLFALKVDTEMSESDVWYAKITLHLSNGLNEPSNVIVLTKHGENMPHQLFVYPPKVEYTMSGVYSPVMTIVVNSPKFYYNTSAHVSTTWRLTDTAGIVFYEREYDYDNLLRLIVPEDAYAGRDAFVIEVVYNFDRDDLDIVGRETVIVNPNSAELTLSKDTLFSNRDNEINILGFRHSLTTATITYDIGGNLSDPIELISGVQESFIIPKDKLDTVTTVTVYISSAGAVTSGVNSVTLDVLSLDEFIVAEMTSDFTSEMINVSGGIDGVSGDPIGMFNGKFVTAGPTLNYVYRIDNGTVLLIADIPKIAEHFSVSPKGVIVARSQTKVMTITDNSPDIVNPISIDTESQTGNNNLPTTGTPLYFTDDSVNVINASGTVNKYDLSSTPQLLLKSSEPKPYNADYVFELGEGLFFTATNAGSYKYTNRAPVIMDSIYSKFKYIVTDTGVIIVAFKVDDKTVDIYHTTLNSHVLVTTHASDTVDQNMFVVYDGETNNIIIITK